MNNEKTKLFQQKKSGDLNIVAEMLGITNKYAYMLIHRESAKRHKEAVEALNKVIKSRKELLNSN